MEQISKEIFDFYTNNEIVFLDLKNEFGDIYPIIKNMHSMAIEELLVNAYKRFDYNFIINLVQLPQLPVKRIIYHLVSEILQGNLDNISFTLSRLNNRDDTINITDLLIPTSILKDHIFDDTFLKKQSLLIPFVLNNDNNVDIYDEDFIDINLVLDKEFLNECKNHLQILTKYQLYSIKNVLEKTKDLCGEPEHMELYNTVVELLHS